MQPWCTPFPIWNQSVVPCPVLTVFSWPACRFLKRQVRWSAIPISFRIFHFQPNHIWKCYAKKRKKKERKKENGMLIFMILSKLKQLLMGFLRSYHKTLVPILFMLSNVVNLSAKCGFYFWEQLDIIWDQLWQIKQFYFSFETKFEKTLIKLLFFYDHSFIDSFQKRLS